jgi:pimeloyl-ACP methyl ester carboxylesterase
MPRNSPSLNITCWGDVGPRVVMVHGSAQGSRVGGDRHFSAQAALKDRGWQIVVPDRPGHGLSPPPGRPDDAELDGEWVAELLEGGAHLVGHSFGGVVALAAAARRPEAVYSLTLIEPAMLALAVRRPAVLWFLVRILLTRATSLTPSTYVRRFARLMHIPDDIRGGANMEDLKQMAAGIAAIRVPKKDVLIRELEAVKMASIPLLVVTGGWSDALEATADAAAEQGAGRRLVIPSPHHFPQLVSDEFNQKLDAFMREAASTN